MKFISVMMGMLLFSGLATAGETTAKIRVKGMTCGACAVSVKGALTSIKGVKSADVSVEKELATVVYDPEKVKEQQLREAISKTGFKVEPAQGGK